MHCMHDPPLFTATPTSDVITRFTDAAGAGAR
jgi:hypothetical protein